jgi:hypothetical protein
MVWDLTISKSLDGHLQRGRMTGPYIRRFVKNDWMPVILPTLKYATQKHYRYMLEVHLIPAFGKSQLRDLTGEDLQGSLSRKLNSGLSWETVHHFKCGLSKILGGAEEWGCVTENVFRDFEMQRIERLPVGVVRLRKV